MTDPALEAAERVLESVQPFGGIGKVGEALVIAAAREALKPIRELVEDARKWTPYSTRDIGSAYLAETVEDLLDELAKLVYPENELE